MGRDLTSSGSVKNLSLSPEKLYHYDAGNRLVQTTSAGGTVQTSRVYDAYNRVSCPLSARADLVVAGAVF